MSVVVVVALNHYDTIITKIAPLSSLLVCETWFRHLKILKNPWSDLPLTFAISVDSNDRERIDEAKTILSSMLVNEPLLDGLPILGNWNATHFFFFSFFTTDHHISM